MKKQVKVIIEVENANEVADVMDMANVSSDSYIFCDLVDEDYIEATIYLGEEDLDDVLYEIESDYDATVRVA